MTINKTRLLTLLLLPLGIIASAIVVAVISAGVAIFSPLLLLAGAIWGGRFAADKLINRFFPNLTNNKSPRLSLVASFLITTLLTLIALAPSAVVIVAAAVITCPLLFVALSFVIAHKIATNSVSKTVSIANDSMIESPSEDGHHETLLNRIQKMPMPTGLSLFPGIQKEKKDSQGKAPTPTTSRVEM